MMATSTLENREYLFRLQMLIIDGGTLVLRNYVDQSLASRAISLSVCMVNERATIRRLRSTGIITKGQYDLLLQPNGNVSTSDLDMILIVCLLRCLKCFGLNQKFDWRITPIISDTSIKANIWRLKNYRNQIAHISNTTGIQESDFKSLWKEVKKILYGINSFSAIPIADLKQTIKEFKSCPLDRLTETRLQYEIKRRRELEKEAEVGSGIVKADNEPILEDVDTVKEDEKKVKEITAIIYERENKSKGKRQDENESVPDAFTHNPYHFELYRKALLEGFETDNAIRVNVVGNFAQGKTSLTNSLVKKSNTFVQSTNGVEINYCRYTDAADDVNFVSTLPFDDIKMLDRLAIVAQNEENPSDERTGQVATSYKNIGSSPKKTRNVVEPTIDPENVAEVASQEHETQVPMHSFDKVNPPRKDVNKWRIYSEPEELQNTHIYEIRSSLSKSEVQIFSERLQCHTSRINHRDGKLEIWDFAGEFVFYATHTLFHSKRAVYLLVFDLSKPLPTVVEDTEDPLRDDFKSNEQYIKFWMNSIHSFVGSDDGKEPPVILVGTHKDQLQGNETNKANLAEVYFERIRAIFANTRIIKHIHEEDFAVNNLNPKDEGIIRLRNEIIRIGKEHGSNTVPARWILQ